ncbi:polysaccharide biosynthesis C-terminal domain-containing protein [Bacillus sp. sid0103]|uniref:oligosaccharide flippase family protein n=1 Tax=Bacillus sp. sid0103 TaxID=2856337 RepID=UPI001C47FB8C|nr:polysaccharide biosynthesis C-terminal domain-containing protein [Bacillus sp. sid0103]MBV7504121.1 polysaccharide biosynthesis C-terminal domain-containing protein [Bacillus sp. sid0103]
MPSIFNKSRISRDTIIYIPIFLAPALINIVLLMVFTRFFSPKDYGAYTIVVNTSIILSSLLGQWILLSVQRFRPEYSKNSTIPEFNRNINHLLLYISLGFLLVVSILFIFIPSFLKAYQNYFWPSVLLIISSIYYMVLGGVYQADLRAKPLRNLNVFHSLLKLVFILVLVREISFKPISFIWGAFFAQFLITLPMLSYVETTKMFNPFKNSRHSFMEFAIKFLKYGFPLIGWYIGTTIMNLTDRYMLEYYRTAYEVGIYSANFTIAVQAIALICNPMFFAIQPIIMNEIQEISNKEHIERRISGFTHLFIIISIPFGVYFSIFCNEVSELLLGIQFSKGAIIIPILIFGFFSWNIGLYGQLTYQISKKTKELFYFVVMAAITNFSLNLFLIPKWGFVGAAISTSIGFIIYSGLLYFFSLRFIKWKIPWNKLLTVFIVAIILAIPFLIIKIRLLIGVSPLICLVTGLPYFLIYFGLVLFFWKNTLKLIIS